jgi:hypothetical protein
MLNIAPVLKNERGALMIIVSIMLLALMTVVSVGASKTANTELDIAANEYSYQRCFYYAEGAVMEAVARLESGPNPMLAPPTWMSLEADVINDDSVFAYWEKDVAMKSAVPRASVVDPAKTGYLVVHHGVPAGSSLGMSKPAKHAFSIYGRSKNKGLVMLKIGYAKVY